MSNAMYVPAIGEQFNSVWNRKIKYKGKDGKEYDMKWFSENSHFKHNISLQSCYYGINGVGKNTDVSYRKLVDYPKDKILIGDSAGFQIASFKKRGEVCNINPIDSLRWQEENCDIMMNLDIPPTLGGTPTFKDFNKALDESVKNFTLFEKERKNYDAKLLNVLHGETIHHQDIWYNAVKDFKFDGWAIGMKPPFDPMIQAMGFMYLWKKGEFEKDSCKWIHFFGTSGKHVVPTIIYAASKLKKDIKVSYDSSSYNIGSIFRTYFFPFEIGPNLYFGDKFKKENSNIKELPCMCPVCQSITDVKELNTKDIYAGTLISLHNMYQYVYYNNLLNSIVLEKETFISYLKKINISKKTLISIEFIDFAMEHGLKKAIFKYKEYLLPQELNKQKQQSIYNF